jgi:hypothetical protein
MTYAQNNLHILHVLPFGLRDPVLHNVLMLWESEEVVDHLLSGSLVLGKGDSQDKNLPGASPEAVTACGSKSPNKCAHSAATAAL